MAQPFYLQVVQSICEQIVADKVAEGDLLPSIRKLSLKYQLNPNTVQRSMAYLVQLEILESARGTGFFVREGAKERFLSGCGANFGKGTRRNSAARSGCSKLIHQNLPGLKGIIRKIDRLWF